MIAVKHHHQIKRTQNSPEFVQHPSYIVKEDWVLERLKKMAMQPWVDLVNRHRFETGTLSTSVPSQSFKLGSFTLSWQGADAEQPGLSITHAEHPSQLLWHSCPGENFIAGHGITLAISENRGAVDIEEQVEKQFPNQTVDAIHHTEDTLSLVGGLEYHHSAIGVRYRLTFQVATATSLEFSLNIIGGGVNQAMMRFATSPDEHFFGFGEQFSYVDCKGHEVPIVCEEGGIGRSDPGPVTLNVLGVAGERFASYAPMPYFLTNTGRALFLKNTEPSAFDLRNADLVTIRVASSYMQGQLLAGHNPLDLIEQFTDCVGRMPPLPDWLNSGAVIGMQGGTQRVRQVWDKLKKYDTPIAGFWLQDWVGQRKTVFGKQLWWNWQLDPKTYPGWDQLVTDLEQAGIAVGVYVNPFLVSPPPEELKGKRNLFKEAAEQGFLVKTVEGTPYLVKNTDFSAGLVDLSNPAARDWFKAIIKDDVLGNGAKFWMADFAEAAQFDGHYAAAESGLTYHNQYPVDWAALNREAIREAGREGDAWFFNRAGYLQTPGHSTGMWLGDQNVTWQEHDGIASTLDGLLSSGMSGISINHSDIGGYTSITHPIFQLFGKSFQRSRELLFRWMELNAFTPVFRTHEGNQPEVNAQFDTDDDTLKTFSFWAKVFAALAEYRQGLMEEAASRGYPLVRHLVLHYPEDPNVYGLDTEFLLGRDLLVTPVLNPGDKTVKVYFPAGEWVHLWSHQVFGKADRGLSQIVAAPLGKPAVFYRKGSEAGQMAADKIRALGNL